MFQYLRFQHGSSKYSFNCSVTVLLSHSIIENISYLSTLKITMVYLLLWTIKMTLINNIKSQISEFFHYLGSISYQQNTKVKYDLPSNQLHHSASIMEWTTQGFIKSLSFWVTQHSVVDNLTCYKNHTKFPQDFRRIMN